MLYSCYIDNGVTSSSFVELLFSIFPKLPGALETVSNTYHETRKQVKDMSKVKSETRASIIGFANATNNLYNETAQRSLESLTPASDTVILEDAANITAGRNETAGDVWTECNVILLPFLVFSFFCLIIFYVLCKYRLCNDHIDKQDRLKDTSE